MSRILIITSDYVGPQMAGPAIRCWEMARVLSSEHDVVLASRLLPKITCSIFEVRHIHERNAFQMCKEAELFILQWTALSHFSFLKECNKPLVIDIYDPNVLENLEATKGQPLEKRLLSNRKDLQVTFEELQRGDFFICASEKQRDFWIGMLNALKRINPFLYDEDPTMESLIGVVPNGISSSRPVHTKKVLKGVLPNIKSTDKVLIWGGSICNWFDPLSLIKAVALLNSYRKDIKLFFMGTRAPNHYVPDYIWSEVARSVSLSKHLGLYQEVVYFGSDWIPYSKRHNYLLEADLGVTLHYDNLETRYSFRTRVLDYLWTGLPIITSEGDYMAELVNQYNLGRVVPCQNYEKVAETIVELLDYQDKYLECRKNISFVRPLFYWEKAMKPLLQYCRNPRKTFQSCS